MVWVSPCHAVFPSQSLCACHTHWVRNTDLFGGCEQDLKPQLMLWRPQQADPEREKDGCAALEVAQLCVPSSLLSSLQDVQVPVCPLCNTPVPVRRGEMPDVVVGEHIDRDCKSDPAQRKRKVGTWCSISLLGLCWILGVGWKQHTTLPCLALFAQAEGRKGC